MHYMNVSEIGRKYEEIKKGKKEESLVYGTLFKFNAISLKSVNVCFLKNRHLFECMCNIKVFSCPNQLRNAFNWK